MPSGSYFDVLAQHPEAQAGFVGWIANYPSPSQFTTISMCGAIAVGQNFARFCDPSIDAQISAALAQQARPPQQASATRAVVDRALTDAAPLVPLLVDTNVVLLSARAHHYEVDPTGPVWDGVWLKSAGVPPGRRRPPSR